MQRHRPLPLIVLLLAAVGTPTLADPPTTRPAPAHPPASQRASADWPLWGGSPTRNAIVPHGALPNTWDLDAGTNIRWKAELGTYSYAGPIVADNRVYVGTNNARALRPQITGDKGILLCFDARTGTLLWQATHDKLAAGPTQDWPEQGIASSPYVDGERLYYVSNRAELVCADVAGFRDHENDGPFTREKYTDQQDADFVWILDMIGQLNVYPRNLAACSPVGYQDLIFVCTANGVDDENHTPPHPDAPSFIAVNKHTGKVVWKRNDPGRNILNGQWSSPAVGEIAGTAQVIFGGGDGWCYSFAAKTGEPLWKFNLNPPGTVWKTGGYGSKTSIVATPVIVGTRVYLAAGDDPEASLGPGHLYAIDATQRGDITTSGKLWHVGDDDFGRTLASVAIADGRLYAVDLDGFLSCLDVATGKRHWHYDMEAGVWASPVVIGDRVLLGNTDGELIIVAHDQKLTEHARIDMHHAIYTMPALVDHTLYIVTQRWLYAINENPPSAAEKK